MKTAILALAFVLACRSFDLAVGGEPAVKVVQKDPPAEVDSSLRKTVKPSAIQVLDGDQPVFEFWLSTEVALQSKPESAAKAMDAIKQSALLGLAVVNSDQRDYKDGELPKGVYTMRFCLQPQDGNHLGTAEFNYFAVLVQAKNDPKLESLANYKELVRASRKDTANDHPIILSLRPPSSTDGDLPKLSEPAPEHKSVRVKISARVAGTGEESSLIFELVFQGKGKT
ncbi:MAG: hypothetical protein HY735_28305 [Verrucomicrobia bacterium]|nr:hypothetical protein [Verrucomicrobiota bacterium]